MTGFRKKGHIIISYIFVVNFMTIGVHFTKMGLPYTYTGKFWRPLNLVKWPEMAGIKFADFKIWQSRVTEKYDVTMLAASATCTRSGSQTKTH